MRKMIILFLLLNVCMCVSAAAQQDFDWESMRPETLYYQEIEKASYSDYGRYFEAPFKAILPKEELKKYDLIPDIYSKKQYMITYWQVNNPNPLADINYALLEFRSRLELVNRKYTRDRPPYIDDRGKYILRYGEPERTHTDPGGIRLVEYFKNQDNYRAVRSAYGSGRPANDYIVFANETWTYYTDDIEWIVFFVKEGGIFKQVDSMKQFFPITREVHSAWFMMDLIKDRYQVSFEMNNVMDELIDFEVLQKYFDSGSHPHGAMLAKIVDVEIKERIKKTNRDHSINDRAIRLNQIEIDLNAAQFRGENGQTRIEVVSVFDINDLFKEENSETIRNNVTFEYKVLLRDTVFNRINSDERQFFYPGNKEVRKENPDVVNALSVTADPYKGDLTVQIKDIEFGSSGFGKMPIEVRDFSGSELLLSDLQIFMPVTDEKQRMLLPIQIIDGIDVIPCYNFEIGRKQASFVYFEVYNLVESGISGQCTIDIRMERPKNIKSRIGKFFGRGDDYALSIRQERNVLENDLKELIALDFSQLDDKDYILSVTITDPKNDERTVTITRDIKIIK